MANLYRNNGTVDTFVPTAEGGNVRVAPVKCVRGTYYASFPPLTLLDSEEESAVLPADIVYEYTADVEGTSGYSGYSGASGAAGTSGFSGYSGNAGGDPGTSGYSGYSGADGASGISGADGISGYSGYSGRYGTSGYSGRSGWSGYSGESNISGYSGYSGFDGASGYSGYSGIDGLQGPNVISGTGPWTITPTADIVPLTVRAAAASVKPIIQWQTNINGALGNIANDGSVIAPQYYVSDLNIAPASATAAGTAGEIRITADHIYVCITTGIEGAAAWGRTPLATWV